MTNIRDFVEETLVPRFTNHIDDILPQMHFFKKGNSYVSKYHTDGRRGSGYSIQTQIWMGSGVVIDYGSSGVNRNVISMFQEFNGIKDRKTAISVLCSICNVKDPFESNYEFKPNNYVSRPKKVERKPYSFHNDEELLRFGIDQSNNFLSAFSDLFAGTYLEQSAAEVISDYKVSSANYGNRQFVVFPYIDNKIREIKLMQYEPNTLHRCGITTNVHSMEKIVGFSDNLSPRLFGYHLAMKNTDKEIAIVESEKTALIMAVCDPTYIWLATGGCSRLTEPVANLLNCRDVRIFFDAEIDDATRFRKIRLLNRHCLSVTYKDDREELKKYGEKADMADVYIPLLKKLEKVAEVVK